MGWIFRRDVDHPCVAVWVKVRELEIAHVPAHGSRARRRDVDDDAATLRHIGAIPSRLMDAASSEPGGTELGYDPVESLRTDGAAFIDLVSAHDPATTIPACPEWNLGDLAFHQGEVWNFWHHIIDDQIQDRGRLREIQKPVRPSHDDTKQWLSDVLGHIVSALTEHPTDQAVWTWTGANRDVAWVHRRMAQEAAIHRYDAAQAVGEEHRIPTAVAADGIDEFLMWFAGTERREGELKPGGTVHLHCTDTGDAGEQRPATGEWFIASLKEPSCTFTREHRKGDAAVRGAAHDLLVWLWRRSTDGVEVIGDEKVARRFRAYTDLA